MNNLLNQQRSLLADCVLWAVLTANTVVSCWMLTVRLPTAPAVETARSVRTRAAAALAEAPPEDQAKVYGLLSGVADYLEAGHPGCDDTQNLLEIWSRAVLISGWELENYPELTDLVEAELTRRGFNKSKKLKPVAAELVTLFRDLAGGIRDASG